MIRKRKFEFHPVNVLLYLTGIAAMLAMLTYAYITFVPIDVLKDWTITNDKQDYKVGETIRITTHAKKIRAVTGISKRYIVCETQNKSKSRNDLPESVADRPASPNGSTNEIYLKIPNTIPDEILPTTCYVEISIIYQNVLPGRDHPEINRTGSFKVSKSDTPQPTTVITPENDNAVVEDAPVNNEIPAREIPEPQSRYATPEMAAQEPVAPVTEESPITQPPERNRVERTLDSIIKTVTSL